MSTEPTWAMLREAIEKMVAYPEGLGWHVDRAVADRALKKMSHWEYIGYPVPRLLPQDDGDLSIVWKSDGWSIHQVFDRTGDYEHAFWLKGSST